MKNEAVLLVDDMEINRGILKEVFKEEYQILEASNGKEGLEIVEKEENNIVTILLDIVMPVMDGFQMLEELQKRDTMKHIPVVLITGDLSDGAEYKGYDLGVSDIIGKPFNPGIVKRRVQNIIELYRYKNHLEVLVSKQTEKIKLQSKKLKETNNQIIDTLSTVVEFRNLESGQHIQRIKGFTHVLMEKVAEVYTEYKITRNQIEVITSASAMHDVGKIAIPDTILLKPGRLTKEEFEIIKTHTTKGCEIIDTLAAIQDEEYYRYSYEICRHHHERYDGKGYPDGLKGEEIPIAAQIVALADVYDALVSQRVYKNALRKEEAYHMIKNGECGLFSPRLLNVFDMVKHSFELLADERG